MYIFRFIYGCIDAEYSVWVLASDKLISTQMATYNFPYSLLQSCKSKFKAADMLLYFLVLSRSKLN